jgi:hypothetical protein
LSISERDIAAANDFDRWIVEEFGRSGAFTALTVLVGISDSQVAPLCSTYFNVIGDEVDWAEITVLLAGSGREWDGVAFFPHVAADGGPLDNSHARVRLRLLEERLDGDRLVLNEGHFFDKWGRRMRIDEVGMRD